jgi:hypothetical protein
MHSLTTRCGVSSLRLSRFSPISITTIIYVFDDDEIDSNQLQKVFLGSATLTLHAWQEGWQRALLIIAANDLILAWRASWHRGDLRIGKMERSCEGTAGILSVGRGGESAGRGCSLYRLLAFF